MLSSPCFPDHLILATPRKGINSLSSLPRTSNHLDRVAGDSRGRQESRQTFLDSERGGSDGGAGVVTFLYYPPEVEQRMAAKYFDD